MPFQSTVRSEQTTGVAGELAFEGPLRAQTGILNTGTPANNIVGSCALRVVSEGVFAAGGTGVFAGILANPKTYASGGTTAGGPLAPTMVLPNGTQVEAVSNGIMFVNLTGAAAIGDLVRSQDTTGLLSTVTPGSAAGAGFTFVPNCVVSHRTVSGAGLAIVTLNN